MYDRLAPDQWFYSECVYVDAERKTDSVIRWIDDCQTNEWFVWVHYMDPHRPYGIDLSDPEFAQTQINRSEIMKLMSKAGQHPSELSKTQRRRIINLYDSDIRYLSNQLSRLVNFLKNADVWDELDLILTADHGEEFGDHGKYFHRNLPYEELLEVPLLMKSSNHISVQDENKRELIDIAPTVCEFFDINPPSDFEGKALTESKSYPHIATGSFEGANPTVAVRWGKWKYIFDDGHEELFDLSNDENETESVINHYTDIASTIRRMVPTRLLSDDENSIPEETGEIEERLEKLGYLE
jgi:Arylsulfatase A and related enzymes